MSAEPDRPSARAVERLATGVGEDVADLRGQLHRALDEAGRLQAAGREDLAVSVLREQRDALLEVHRRLESRLAEAAVEREAERVLGTAARDAPEPTALPVPAAGDDGMAMRLFASAVAAVFGVALLVTPELGSGQVTAAGTAAASSALEDLASSRATDAGNAAATTPATTNAERDASGAMRVTDLRALLLPEADVLASGSRDAGDDGPDHTDGADLVPLPGVGPTVDALTSVTPDVADDGEDQPDTGGSDDGSASGESDGPGDATAPETASGEDGEGASQDAPEDDASGPDGVAATDDGSSDDEAAGDGGDATETDGGGTSGGDLDLGDTSGEPTGLER